MAAPAAGLRLSYVFRDAKGQTARVRVLIGDATAAAIITDYNNGAVLLQAVSNAFVTEPLDYHRLRTYGTASNYQNVEDKAVLTFKSQQGSIARFQVPAPKTAGFLSDQETVNAAETNMAALITWFSAYTFENITDTTPLVYVGGVRGRRKYQRRYNIFTLDPSLAIPGE